MSGINNTVTISENANPETTALYGGLSSSGNKLTDPLNVNNTTGNGFTAKNVATSKPSTRPSAKYRPTKLFLN